MHSLVTTGHSHLLSFCSMNEIEVPILGSVSPILLGLYVILTLFIASKLLSKKASQRAS